MHWRIRVARPDDAAEVHKVIVAALRETNARDYAASVIARLEESFGPAEVQSMIDTRKSFVAVEDDEGAGSRIVGTAALDGSVVRTVFVAPDVQGKGVGRLLMAEVEKASREAGVEILTVPASLTGEPFYAKLGFKAVRETFYEEARTIIMERSLGEGPAAR